MLYLSDNRFGALRAGAFAGLDSLYLLNLERSGITSLGPGLFAGTPHLRYLSVRQNRLRELMPEALRALALRDFDLGSNPGTPFTFAPTPVAMSVDNAGLGAPVELAVEIASAAPFPVEARLLASGGSLSSSRLAVHAGEVRSRNVVVVTPDGDTPVTVSVGDVELPRPDGCSGVPVGLSGNVCYRGVRVAPGPPVVLYGMDDRALTQGRDVDVIDLVEVFAYFLGAAGLRGLVQRPGGGGGSALTTAS